jgi:riboflavin biosynthesis pyrimidine reductase
VEGGAEVLGSFLNGGHADEIRRLVSTTLHIPDGYSAPDISLANGFAYQCVEEIGGNRLEYYRKKESVI